MEENNVRLFDNLYSEYESSANLELYSTAANDMIGILQNLNISNVKKIYELCCGTGILTQRLAQLYHDAQITGYDASSGMLRLAKEKNIDKTELILQDINQLRVNDEKAEIIVSNYGMQWLDIKTLNYISSMLCDGGVFICSLPGYITGNIEISKAKSNYVGNMLFKAILNVSANNKYREKAYTKKIIQEWQKRIDADEIKNAAKFLNLSIIDDYAKGSDIVFQSVQDLVVSIINRGIFGDIFSYESSDFVQDLIKYVEKLSIKYNNLCEENITRFLVFQKI